jgi:hypothetical protein
MIYLFDTDLFESLNVFNHEKTDETRQQILANCAISLYDFN